MDKIDTTKRKNEAVRERHRVIGIDPGISGGVAVYCAEEKRVIFAVDIPVDVTIKSRKKTTKISVPRLADMIADAVAEYDVCAVAVEKVHSSPQMGVTSAFSFGHTFGIISAVCEQAHPNVIYVSPAQWKARMLVGTDKKKTVERAQKLFGVQPWFGRISKDGVAEAALIAYYAASDLVSTDIDPLS